MDTETISFIAVFAALIIETICAGLWLPGFFRRGIPLFAAQAAFEPGATAEITTPQLEKHFEGNIGPSLVFRKLGVDEWAFRVRMFQFRMWRGSLMRGHLYLDRNRGVVKVRGLAYYSPFVFAAYFFLIVPLNRIFPTLLPLFIIFGITYGIDLWQFRRVARIASGLMTAPIVIDKLSTAKKLADLDVFHWPMWEKEASEFPWHYDERETCYILTGNATVTPEGGEPVRFGTGDFVTFPAGLSCHWKIHQPVKKHYRLG